MDQLFELFGFCFQVLDLGLDLKQAGFSIERMSATACSISAAVISFEGAVLS